jgi:DNA-directed RNA polymerase specialized sigma24 family protein
MHIHNQPMGGHRTTFGATLFQRAQSGCLDSLNRLMVRHDGLVQAVVRRQVLGDLPFAEALQAGRIGLWRAIQGYDFKRGTAFSTYAWPCIMRQVWRAVKVHTRFRSSLVTSDGLPLPQKPDPALVWEAAAVQQALHHLVDAVPGRLRYVVVARYGLDGTPPATYRQIGIALGLCAVCWNATRWLTTRSPLLRPSAGCDGRGGVMAAELTPVETRAQDPTFVAQCSLDGLRDRLPLRWPAPPDTPPSPKKRYRSHYLYLGWEDLEDSVAWEHFSDFDLLLRLVDYTSLRPVLAQLLGWTSARGQVPFDPVSIFLLTGWQITNGWSRAQTLRNLRQPRYVDCAQRFGFEDGVFPTEGGLRYWLTTIGQNSTSEETVLVDEEGLIEIAIQRLNQLLAQSVALFVEVGLLSPEALKKAVVCPDGMIHDAASRMRCPSVTDTCYQSTSPHNPRPCPAKEKDRRGCDCDTTACAQACRYATPRDPKARFIWYSGSNRTTNNPNQSTDPAKAKKKRGKGRFGYRTLPLQLTDPARRFSLVLLDDPSINSGHRFLPANEREEIPATALLLQLPIFYPDLEIDAVAGDAGFGYDIFLPSTCAPTQPTETRPFGPCAATTTRAVPSVPLVTPSKPTASTSTASVTSGSASTPAATTLPPSPLSKALPTRLISAPTSPVPTARSST